MLSKVKCARSPCPSIVLMICFRCQKSTLLLRSGPKRGFESFLCSASHRFTSVARSTNCSTELRNIIIRKIKIMQKRKNNSERRSNDAEMTVDRKLGMVGSIITSVAGCLCGETPANTSFGKHERRDDSKQTSRRSKRSTARPPCASYPFPGAPWTCGRLASHLP